MNKNAKFWSRIAGKYAANPVPNQEVYQKKLAITGEYLKPDMRILEFGCGTGSTALFLAHKVEHILAIDIAEGMLNIAKQKAKQQKVKNVDFQLASMEQLDTATLTFDVILGHSILHLLEDKDKVIAQAFDMLQPGGVFITSTTCIADIFKFHKLLEWFGPIGRFLGVLPLVNIFSSQQLMAALTDAGFDLEYTWQPQGKGKSQAIFIIAKKPHKTK